MKKLTYLIAITAIGACALTTMAIPGSHDSTVLRQPNNETRSTDEPLVPEKVRDLKIAWDMNRSGFDISFTAPVQGSYFDWSSWSEVYGVLTTITKIDVSLNNGYNAAATLLHTFENPAPGEKLSYFEDTLERGRSYDFVVTVYANGEQSEGANMYAILAGGVPALPTDLKLTTTEGAVPVTLTFTAPSYYSDGITPLDNITKGELWTKGGWYDDPALITTITDITPGHKVEYTINDQSLEGEQNWLLTLFSEDGPSEKIPVNFFIGTDTPGKVTSLVAEETGEGVVNLSWGIPETGSRGGYFNPSELKYDVKVYTPGSSWGDDCETVATDLAETAYTYTISGNEPKKLRFSVTPHTAAGQGTETKGDYMVIGPALTLPFTETFDAKVSADSYTYDHLWGTSTTCGESNPPEWNVSEYCYDGNTRVQPPGGSGALAHLNTYGTTPVSDFMLTSTRIAVGGAGTLDFSYNYYVSAPPSGGTSMSAAISFDNKPEFETVHSVIFEECETKGWQTAAMTGIQVPAGASTAQIRITARNSKEAVALAIDDIKLRAGEALPDVYPASVSDFNAALNSDGSAIDITMTAPTMTHPSLGDKNNQPLTMISRISLQRQIGYGIGYEEIHEFLSPLPGSQLSFSDTDVARGGEYSYKAVVYVGSNCDYGNYLDNPVTVGQIPGEVSDFTVSSTRGAAPVVLRFRLPAADYKGESLRSITGVMITRYNSETFVWDEVAHLTENLVPGEYASWTDTGVRSGEVYEYRVVCEGTAGNSYGVSQNVYVGADTPEEPRNLKAVLGDDGLVHLTWEAPVKGLNNGYIDTDHLVYIVQRGNCYSDYDAELLKSDVTTTSFTDPTTFGDEEIVKYFVKAVSGQMTGYSAMSNTLLVGNPNELPFTENFNKLVGENIQPVNASWTIESSESAPNWAFAEMAYFLLEGQVAPVDRDGGLAYSFYGPYSTLNRHDYLISGNMDVSGIERPGLGYHVYGVPGYDTALGVEVSFDGGAFQPLINHDFKNDISELGWQKVEIPVDVPAGARKMRLRFVARKGDYSCSVAIDNVHVAREFDGSGISSTPLCGVMVGTSGGRIVVCGLGNGEPVAITDLGGRMMYTGKGDCSVSLDSGVYLVTLRGRTVKIRN